MGSWTDHVGSGVIALVGIITAATAFAVGVHSQAPRLRAWRQYDEEAHKTQLTATRHLANFEQIEEKFLWLDKITETREILNFQRARDKKSKIRPSYTAETGRSPVTQPFKGVLDNGGGSAQDLHYARNMSKAFFIYDVIQREIRRGRRIKTLCEMGFYAGHSAMLLLDSAPGAKLYEFYGGHATSTGPLAQANLELFSSLYGDRFEYRPPRNMYYTRGLKGGVASMSYLYAKETMPQFIHDKGFGQCDVILIDGPVTGRSTDIDAFKQAAHVGSLVFISGAHTFECAAAQVPLDHPACSNAENMEIARSYWALTQGHELEPIACSEKATPTAPGTVTCLWQYTPDSIATARENATSLVQGLEIIPQKKGSKKKGRA